MRRILLLLGLTALVALGGDQALTGAAGGTSERDRWQTRLRLFASQPVPRREARRSGALRVEIPSFGHVGREGDVYLPIRTIRIAIPDSAGEVRIEGVRTAPKRIHGLNLDPPAAPGRRVGAFAGSGPAAEAAARGGGARPEQRGDFSPPGEPIRLGDVGWLRDQRFVEIVYTPVVSPPGGGEALFHGDVEVDIAVEGVAPGAVSDLPAPSDPFFEDAYRRAFANYAEGRFLRSRRPVAPGGAGPLAAAGLEGASASGYAAEAGIAQTHPDYKITVSKDGLYHLTRSYLLDPNTGVAPGLAGADPRQFKLMNRGVEVPIYVRGEADGSFDAGDFIEFYGQRLDGPETKLNYDLGLLPSIYQYDDYADGNVYWLSVDGSGTRSRIPVRSAPPNGGYPVEPDFAETLHFEVDTLFLPTGGEDPFLMAPRLNSNNGSVAADANTCFYSNPGIPSQTNGNYLGPGFTDPNNAHYCPICRMSLPGIATSAPGTATVTVRVRGTTDESAIPDHLAVVEVNGVASRYGYTCFNDETFATVTFPVAQNLLTNPLDIRIEQPGLAATVSTEQLIVDSSQVTYRRLFQAVNDGLRFTVPDNPMRITVSGLSSNDPNVVVAYEITETLQPAAALGGAAVASPVRVIDGAFGGTSGNRTLTFTSEDDPNSTQGRTYVVAGPGSAGLLLPDGVVEDVPSNLHDPTVEADVIVLGDPNLMDLAPGSAFRNYWDHRTSADGWVVKFVSILDVIDEFGYGIPHPESIRSFLSYAYDNWKGPLLDPNRSPPSYITLVGDTTADPKNNLNRADWVQLLPAFVMYQQSSILGYYSSDAYISAFRGADQLPDIHLGRLPIRTAADAVNVFTKLLDYDTVPMPSPARGRGLFICDEGKAPGESSEFERITDDLIANWWQPQPPLSAVKLYYDDPNYNNGTNVNKMYADIVAAMNSGITLQQYTGHGSFGIWGVDGYFWSSDVAGLQANGIYSFGINENCLSGGFHAIGGDALSEAFLKAQNKGAVAFFAPAGLSFSFIGESINNRIYSDLMGPRRIRRFGPLLTDVRLMLAGIGSIMDQQSYTLVGDPTQNYALPAPRPPRNAVATGGNAQVDLTWTPSLDPNTLTRVYRAVSPAGPYTLLTPTPLSGTAYTDATTLNAVLYFYQLSSVDAEGFEGARSHFSTDCVPSDPPASGPDCLWAKPLNPDPPSTPTGTNVFGDGSGVRLRVVWNPNPETDIGQYVVRYGTQQGGPYPSTATAGPTATEATINGLVQGTLYYLRVSAKNTSGLESPPSGELVGKAVVFDGQNPPQLIEDLQIDVTVGDPNSLTLFWSRPTHTIYGAPATVVSYEIYRDVSPGFIPSPANRIAIINDPNQTFYIDVGAHVAAPDWFYAVGSKDALGQVSGVGLELPNGVSELLAELISGDTVVRFTWPAVTSDVRGGPTIIDRYILYASGSPIPRTSTDAMTPLVDGIHTNAVDVPVDAAHKFYTVIVVDTRGNKSPF